jgi:ornithine carbamoyltransferase
MMVRHFLTLLDFSEKEIKHLLDLAVKLKSGELEEKLEGRTLAMLFEKTSTRTRVSFEVAMTQLGGHAIFLDTRTTKLAEKETLKDTVRVLERYCDAIVGRVYKHSDLEEAAAISLVPVINGLSEKFHPCQTMADMLTVLEKKGKLDDLKVAFVGDCGFNMFTSTMIGFSKMWSNVVGVCPPKKEYMPDPSLVERAKKHAKGSIKIEHDPIKGVRDADVVITDKWVSPGQEKDEKQRLADFKKYQVNAELLKHAKEDCIFMHCLPALRGYEVTSEVIDGRHSVVFDEAENRLHVQKALLLYLLKGV